MLQLIIELTYGMRAFYCRTGLSETRRFDHTEGTGLAKLDGNEKQMESWLGGRVKILKD